MEFEGSNPSLGTEKDANNGTKRDQEGTVHEETISILRFCEKGTPQLRRERERGIGSLSDPVRGSR